MSLTSKLQKLSLVLTKPHKIFCKPKYLFMLGHMRARSSVFSHVLGSNKEICGYRELLLSYRNRIDLMMMRINLYQEFEEDLGNIYLLDKVLHDRFVFSESILKLINPKFIIFIREPESTIKSIINLGEITGIELYKDPDYAVKYYIDRLVTLKKFAEKLNGEYFFVESDDLVKNTSHVLSSISNWLALKEPLSQNYTIFDKTGKEGFGDPSKNIKSGVIENTRQHSNISLSDEFLQEAWSVYRDCKTYFVDNSKFG